MPARPTVAVPEHRVGKDISWHEDAEVRVAVEADRCRPGRLGTWRWRRRTPTYDSRSSRTASREPGAALRGCRTVREARSHPALIGKGLQRRRDRANRDDRRSHDVLLCDCHLRFLPCPNLHRSGSTGGKTRPTGGRRRIRKAVLIHFAAPHSRWLARAFAQPQRARGARAAHKDDRRVSAIQPRHGPPTTGTCSKQIDAMKFRSMPKKLQRSRGTRTSVCLALLTGEAAKRIVGATGRNAGTGAVRLRLLGAGEIDPPKIMRM